MICTISFEDLTKMKVLSPSVGPFHSFEAAGEWLIGRGFKLEVDDAWVIRGDISFRLNEEGYKATAICATVTPVVPVDQLVFLNIS